MGSLERRSCPASSVWRWCAIEAAPVPLVVPSRFWCRSGERGFKASRLLPRPRPSQRPKCDGRHNSSFLNGHQDRFAGGAGNARQPFGDQLNFKTAGQPNDRLYRLDPSDEIPWHWLRGTRAAKRGKPPRSNAANFVVVRRADLRRASRTWMAPRPNRTRDHRFENTDGKPHQYWSFGSPKPTDRRVAGAVLGR